MKCEICKKTRKNDLDNCSECNKIICSDCCEFLSEGIVCKKCTANWEKKICDDCHALEDDCEYGKDSYRYVYNCPEFITKEERKEIDDEQNKD